MTTHYDVLGVKRSADAAAIRAAYIAQIKRHHPDALQRKGRAQDDAKAQEINRAFDVLRDPERRAEYDLSLDAPPKPPPPPIRQTARRPAVLRPAAPVAVQPRKPVGRLILLILLIAGATAAAWHWAPWPDGQRGAQAEEAPRGEQAPPPEVEGDDVDDAVTDLAWIAEHGTPTDALAYSRHCHAELSPQPRFSLLDRCAAFDNAAARWLESQQPEGAAGVARFFGGPVRERRFREAMALIGADPIAADERLARIDTLTGAAFGRTPAVTRPANSAAKAPPFEGIGD